jgi:suppressor of G2 allele of SKP1
MPSYTSLGDQALKAFNASNYPEAITLYTQALDLNPEVPDYYLKRSTSYQRGGQYELALHDAELAVALANKRGKRELIGSAQLRRGVAFHLLGRYGDAGFCFDAAEKRCNDREKNMIAIWRKKLEMALEKLDEDDTSREVTVLEIPQVEIPKPKKVEGLGMDRGAKGDVKETATASQGPSKSTPAPPPAPVGVITPVNKIRHEWYQTGTHVVLSLFVKGVPKDQAVVDISEKNVCLHSFTVYYVCSQWEFASANRYRFRSRSLSRPAAISRSISIHYGTKLSRLNPNTKSSLPKSNSCF